MILFKMALAAAMMTIASFFATLTTMAILNEKFEQDPEKNEESVSLSVMLSTITISFLSSMAAIMLYKLLLE